MNESPSHRWFQFSIGRMLICITIACVVLVFWRGLGFGGAYLTVLCGGAFALAAWRGPKEIPIIVAASLQLLAAAMFLFAPIGFDHYSEWGLDWTDAMGLLFVYSVSLITGLSVAVIARQWTAVSIQIGMLCIALLLVCLGVTNA